jgi:hypothetical protein
VIEVGLVGFFYGGDVLVEGDREGGQLWMI